MPKRIVLKDRSFLLEHRDLKAVLRSRLVIMGFWGELEEWGNWKKIYQETGIAHQKLKIYFEKAYDSGAVRRKGDYLYEQDLMNLMQFCGVRVELVFVPLEGSSL